MEVLTLFKRLFSEIMELAGEEFALAKVEITTKLRWLGIGVALFAIVAVMAVAFFAVLTAAAVLALSTVVAPWLAACIVAGAYLLLAIGCAVAGRAMIRKGLPPTPIMAFDSLKENVAWAKALAISKRT